MRIAVIGAGGVGGYFGARLAAAGDDVTFVARGEHGRAIRERGIDVRSIHGDVHVDDVTVTADAGDIGSCDVVLFCVKSFSTDEAARAHLPHLVGPETAVISLQNGVGNLERIAAVVGWEAVVGGVALIFSTITSPGVIEHTGGPARILFGEVDGSSSARVARFHERCVAAGIDAVVASDIGLAMWNKFAFICAQAGTTAAVRLPLGDIRDAPHTWRLFRHLAEETLAVAAATGLRVPADAADRLVEQAAALPAEAYSSLHHDLVTGGRMELDALHGEVLRRADRHGVPVPATAAIHAVLEPWAIRNAARAGR